MTLPMGNRLDPRAVMLWRLQGLIRLGLFGIPFFGAAGVGIGSVSSPAVGATVAGLLIALNLSSTLLWPALEYRVFRYMVRERDLLVTSGVLFRRWSSIPRYRIQHVDTRQGPVERMLGLARLQVFTAAGMSADGSIPGLAVDEAERLRDILSQRGGDDGV